MAPTKRNSMDFLSFMDIEILARQFYEHQQHMLGRSKETLRGNRGAIKAFCKFSGIEKVEDITENILREMFLDGRTNRNWQPLTFITRYRNLNVFFEWCCKNRYLPVNPLKDIELPKAEKRLPPKLSKQNAAKLLEVIYNYPYPCNFLRYRNHAIFATYMFAGLRKSELLRLKLTDVDLQNLTIFVHQGKGSKDRIIPMSFTLAQTLKRYLDERTRLGKTCPEFFTSLHKNMGFRAIGLRRLVDKMRTASGITFTLHRLRHTFATLMLEGGCDIYSLSRMMGHSDIKTTTIYLAASPEHLRTQITKHPLNNEVR